MLHNSLLPAKADLLPTDGARGRPPAPTALVTGMTRLPSTDQSQAYNLLWNGSNVI